MSPEPTTAEFASLLDLLRTAADADRPVLIDRLVAAAVPRVRRLTQAILRGRMGVPGAVETDDVLQDTLFGFAERLAAGLAGVVATPQEMFNYVCGIIRRQATDAVRRVLGQRAGRAGDADPDGGGCKWAVGSARRPEPLPDGDLLVARGEFADQVVVRLTVNELMGTLSADDQEFLNLRVVEGMTRDDLAERCGTTAEAVRWRESQLLRRLRQAAEREIGAAGPQEPPPGSRSLTAAPARRTRRAHR